MSALRVLSLCTGYAGLDHAIEEVLADTELAYVADPGSPINKKGAWDLGPKILLEQRYPGVRNLGDITKANWHDLDGIDILAAGFPCTDISNAGLRAGIEGARSGIWANVADAIRVLRPQLVVLENVAALLGRGMGRVLGDLSEIGYDACWTCVRASDIGAAHRRERVFIVAEPAYSDGRGWRSHLRPVRPGQSDAGRRAPVGLTLPTPKASDGDRRDCAGERNRRSPSLVSVGALLPTPTAANSHGNHTNSRGDLRLPGVAALLPTPTVADSRGTRNATAGRHDESEHHDGWTLADVAYADRWGDFGSAIAGWETAMGRPAPEATEPGANPGSRRLSPRFVEWLMGCDDGWVTDLIAPNRDPRPGQISRNSALRLLGNGVVKQQGAHALRALAGVS